MAVKIFILGRPGSGKSTAIRHIEAYLKKDYPGWSVIPFNDYEILQEMFRVEKLFPTNRPKFRETEHGGFDVVDFSVLDTVLKELERQVRGRCSTKDELIFIEFARDDYSKALEQFSHTFLQDAHFLFLDTDVRTCIQRVH
jgi:nucleoside-triphosphatase THEP1